MFHLLNQLAYKDWAAPVKQQNKQMKNEYIQNRGAAANNWPDMPEHTATNRGRFINNNVNTNGNVGFGGRLAGPIGKLPALMAGPQEALGMYGAAQEAKQQGVNPMVHWMQRMTPVPIVQPTGNGGEVYNHQTNERYTPVY